jgi:LEA14-like dessication related protein
MRKHAWLFTALILMFTVFSFSASLRNDISILQQERQIRDLSPESVTLVFYVNITNASKRIYYLSGYSYRFVVKGTEYLRLETALDESISVGAQGDILVAVPVKITYSHLFRVIPGIQEDGDAVCYLTGEMRFSDGRKDRGSLPIGLSGEFPIFKKPEIEFVLLHAKTLTFAGADLDVDVAFKNSNGFELLIDNITYQLELEGYTVGEGTISGDNNIAKSGQRVFSLPFLLNFYEVGKEVHSVLQQESAGCRISGKIIVQTIWERLTIPFDERGTIKIIRPS